VLSKYKLTNLTPLFRKHLSADDEAMIAIWRWIEDEMQRYKPDTDLGK